MNDSTSRNNKGKNSQNVKNRRKAPRLDATAIPSLKGINEVGGPEVKLINISRGGALIESQERLSTGSNICLRLVTEDKVHLIKGRVLRYSVSSLVDGVIRYQSAIVFDEDFTMMPEKAEEDEIQEVTQVEPSVDGNDSAMVAFNSESAEEFDEDPKIVTVNASAFFEDSELQKSLRLNNWLAT